MCHNSCRDIKILYVKMKNEGKHTHYDRKENSVFSDYCLLIGFHLNNVYNNYHS